MASIAPNVGHAEMRCVPDEADKIWTDPRTGKRIDNRKRVLRAAQQTCLFLMEWQGSRAQRELWGSIKPDVESAVAEKEYDTRKERFQAIAGEQPRYSKITRNMEKKHKAAFVLAAMKHLAAATESLETLPWG